MHMQNQPQLSATSWGGGVALLGHGPGFAYVGQTNSILAGV